MDSEIIFGDELKIWNFVKKYPCELGFILQEKDYQAYCDTFTCDPTSVYITEEEFWLIRNYFEERLARNESSY